MMRTEQRERGWIMKKVTWGILVTLTIVLLLIGNVPKRPRLVNSINSGETAYLTVLVDKRETKDQEKLEEKILKMCREDSFSGIKLQAEDKEPVKKYYIKVYRGEKALEEGKEYILIEQK